MIVISAGMQKSGSAYIYNIINDLLVESGGVDARLVKEQHDLDDVMKWHNNNVGKLEKSLLKRLVKISKSDGSFVVKTHGGPTSYLNRLMWLGKAKTIYIYRDPRDVTLSAIDHGKKILEQGDNHTFANMVDFDKAVLNVRNWIKIYEAYNANKRVLCVQYEQIMQEPMATVKRLCQHLGIEVSDEKIQTILQTYDRKNPNANMTGLHFNKAKMKRYETEMTEEQRSKVKDVLGASIAAMGYEI